MDTKAIRKFEALWAKYVEALEEHDSAKGQEGGHARRTRIAAGKRVKALAARRAPVERVRDGCVVTALDDLMARLGDDLAETVVEKVGY